MRAVLIASCAIARPYGIFAASITSTCGPQFGEQFRGREPVGDDEIGAREQPATAHGDEVGVARSPADQRHARLHRRRRVRNRAGLQRLEQRGPHRGGAAVLRHRRGPRVRARRTRPVAGVTAVPRRAMSARTQKVRLRSAAATMAAFVSGSSVQAMTYQASSRSPSRYSRRCSVSWPAAAMPSTAGVTSRATTCTSAPEASSLPSRRCATEPPPTTTTRRLFRSRPTR